MRKQSVQIKGQTLRYILTVQDVFSPYVWLRALPNKASKNVALALSELYMEVGAPKVLQADNGGEFKKAVEKLCKTLAVKIVRSSPYHPQSQGKVERSHRALRKKIAFDMAHLNKNGINWATQLNEYQRLQNEESMEALGRQSPFEVFYGRQSNAVKNHVQGGRCVNEGSKPPQKPKKKDVDKNIQQFQKIRNKARKASNIWDMRYIERRMKNNPPSTYSVGETVLVRFPFSRTSKSAPKRRYVIQAKVIKRNLKLHRYKVTYEHPQISDKRNSWVSVEDITSLTADEEKKKKEAAKMKKKVNKKTVSKTPPVPSQHYEKLEALNPYQEFENQGYALGYNPSGDGNCQLSAVAHQLQKIAIFRSAETLRDEVCKYLEEHDSASDGMPLELFTGIPWTEYLQQMARDGTYGDQLTLQAIADMFNVQLDIISSSGEDYTTHIMPQYSQPIATFALGHFTEDHGMHYVSLTESYDHHISNSRNMEMGEDQNHSDKDDASATMSANDEDGITDDRDTSDMSSNDGLFKNLPDEIVDMIFRFLFSELTNRALVESYNTLFNTCRRFRRIVSPYRHQLPQVHFRKDMAPGWHSILSLCRQFGKWSGVMIELKRIIDSNRWFHAWVYLMYTGIQAWYFVQSIKWKKRK